ncbi:hypothetical protein [Winogradskya humida]|uniref:Uncharacterized protein n=1 Tax=Winogradskya humida TaxID=113566 RepID=A0ABQ3ZM37_9ACTN|nr:hypothetical protein [Actinoplanes humidus]GIE19587.1 hypothetical protein Ahu01nite_026890 [Actinoplanes humidus]
MVRSPGTDSPAAEIGIVVSPAAAAGGSAMVRSAAGVEDADGGSTEVRSAKSAELRDCCPLPCPLLCPLPCPLLCPLPCPLLCPADCAAVSCDQAAAVSSAEGTEFRLAGENGRPDTGDDAGRADGAESARGWPKGGAEFGKSDGVDG